MTISRGLGTWSGRGFLTPVSSRSKGLGFRLGSGGWGLWDFDSLTLLLAFCLDSWQFALWFSLRDSWHNGEFFYCWFVSVFVSSREINSFRWMLLSTSLSRLTVLCKRHSLLNTMAYGPWTYLHGTTYKEDSDWNLKESVSTLCPLIPSGDWSWFLNSSERSWTAWPINHQPMEPNVNGPWAMWHIVGTRTY